MNNKCDYCKEDKGNKVVKIRLRNNKGFAIRCFDCYGKWRRRRNKIIEKQIGRWLTEVDSIGCTNEEFEDILKEIEGKLDDR